MNPRLLSLVALFSMAAMVRVEAAPRDPKTRSVSGSRQFIVYCSDVALRGQITSFVEEVKRGVLDLLGEEIDRWRIPIVLTLDQAKTSKQAPVRFQMISTPDGTKIEINAEIGNEPRLINLQKQITRAVILEIAYRDRPPIRGGERYLEAPWWLVDGTIQVLRRREIGVDSDLFRRLVENNKILPIADFLLIHPGEPGSTAEAIDGAYAMALVQALLDQPNGRTNLGRLVRNWPDNGDDPAGALSKDFPGLSGTDGALQKWWTLNLARFAAADRYRGLSVDDTEKQLAEILHFELAVEKSGVKKKFEVRDFAQFIDIPASRREMVARQNALVALSVQGNALFRPVIAEYGEILSLLARGKTRGVAERLESIERYRAVVLTRMTEIRDYLNWYEATQIEVGMDEFDGYLKAVRDLEIEDERRLEPIRKYLDQLEKEL